jgi:hypothetical protein
MEEAVETLDQVEAALRQLEREAQETRTEQLREVVQELIEDYRAAIKALRRLYQ